MDKHWMDNLPASIPKIAFTDLRQAFIPSKTPDNSYLELSIRIADEDLTVRDLGAFLDFIDGIYGRLAEEGFQSYARREFGHLKVERIQKGSWELLIREVVNKQVFLCLNNPIARGKVFAFGHKLACKCI